MKIALIIEHFDATRGSAEHLAVWIANQLAARGHEIHVVCHDVSARINRYRQATQRASHDADLSHRAIPPAEVSHQGIHLHRLKGVRVSSALGFRLFGTRARQWCARNQPDIVHSLTVAFPGDIYHPCAGVYAAMQAQAAASRKTNAATTIKRVLLRLPGKQRTLLSLEKKAAQANGSSRFSRRKGPRRIITQCPMMSSQFQQFYQVNSARITELAMPSIQINGAQSRTAEIAAQERAWFRGHYRLAPGDRVALFVGHDFRRKGLRYAIETIARTQTPWKLLVVGLGKAREFVELAETLGIGDTGEPGAARVLFVGPTREMEGIYQAGDALLLPTFYDPGGLVAREALTHGLPVISTEFLGLSDLVRKHRAGTIVAGPRSINEMAAALDSLPALGTVEHQPLAARARAAGNDGITPERYIDSLLTLYTSIENSR